MKGVVCYQFGQPLVVEDIEINPPKTVEVKVRMAATAIYHRELHVIQGDGGVNCH